MTTKFLEELERLENEAVNGPIDGYIIFLIKHANAIAELVRAAQEVIRISDRKHDAWDAAKAALDKLNGGKS